ncbi:hypothetical protein V495_07333 [Pseudogymnoascus sp. VKM F-4514 (FW-929)]|nr:hypothetical protein V495_07333 [Pseudogymnoascus sp. VKM F-4514 (FW-929)]
MECGTTVALGGSIHIKRRVVYEAPPGSPAITLHSFWMSGGTMLYHRRGGKWREVPFDGCCWGIWDDPDVEVNVSQHECFTSLEAGEAWTLEYNMDPTDVGEIPRGVAVGDVFRYRYKGTEMDWWDWGGKKEHAETTVKLPSFISGRVVDPWDNNGRPKLVIPASDAVEFTIV